MGSPISGKSENRRDATGGANYVSVMDGVPVTNPKKRRPEQVGQLSTSSSILHAFVLQVVNSFQQLSQSTRLERVPSLLEVHDC
jgi:hypothetical protein